MNTKENTNLLINGECLEVMKMLIKEGKKFEAIITDLPFGTTQHKDDIKVDYKEMWELVEKLKKDEKTPIVFFGTGLFEHELIMSNPKAWKYSWIVDKVYATNHLNTKHQPMRLVDKIHIFGGKTKTNYYPQKFKGKPNHSSGTSQNHKNSNYGQFKNVRSDQSGDKFPKDLIKFDYGHPSIRKHQQQKPIELMEYLVKTYSLEGDNVLDFTMGSGSTGIACMNLNRNFVGIEKSFETFSKARVRKWFFKNNFKW